MKRDDLGMILSHLKVRTLLSEDNHTVDEFMAMVRKHGKLRVVGLD